MAKGAQAKQNLINKFIEACGDAYVGNEDGKKYYFWSSEDGEQVQVCVSMTCPKVPFGGSKPVAALINDWSNAEIDVPWETSTPPVPEISESDRKKVAELKEMLNLF